MSAKHLTAHSGFTHSHPRLPAVPARVCACFPAPSLLPQLPWAVGWGGQTLLLLCQPVPVLTRGEGLGNNVERAQFDGSVTEQLGLLERHREHRSQSFLRAQLLVESFNPRIIFAQSCWE